jgi:regulator of sigma E protease
VTPAFDEKSGLGYLGWMERAEIQIAAVVGGLDAERVGLRAGDILVSANGEPIRSTPKLHEIISKTGGQPVELVYKRDGQEHKVTVTPSKQEAEGQQRWMIGVQLDRRVIITQLGFVPALTESVRSNIKSAGLIYRFLEGIIERRMSPKSLEGPLRIAQISGEKAREGASAFLELMAMVSLNLAILNLLPIPILDGGVILMLLVEMLLRRDLSLRVKETVVKVGFVFLMMVVVFVLYNDLSKILPQG